MIWKAKRNRDRNRKSHTGGLKRRSRGPERLEPRRLLAADPLHIGIVYLETDYLESDQDVGGDSRGDRFILSFTGGAPDTELNEVRIRTDKDGDGISIGDPIYDSALGGRGKSGAHGFEIVRVVTEDGHSINANVVVEDGGQELVLQLSNFRSGDRLEFTLDVDEVLRNSTDLDIFNDRLDVITSGQEFQDSILEATFNAPNYETSHTDAIFLNDYGDPGQLYGLNLPPDDGDDVDSRPDRSAAALSSVVQVPKPIDISGFVWLDQDLDAKRESGEEGLAGVEISLWRLTGAGEFEDTGHRSTTDASGRYHFSKSLGLLPGQYRLVETQPTGLLSVAAVPGTVNGSMTGTALSNDVLSDINIPLGDQSAIRYDFAEATPAAISGFVYQDDDNDGVREDGELGIPGIRVRLVPVTTLATQTVLVATTGDDGSYAFTDLSPGLYEVTEVDQPVNLNDGIDTVGRVNGALVGVALNPGDFIGQVMLNGGEVGTEYNFGELQPASLSGRVHADSDGDCEVDEDEETLAGVTIQLFNAGGAEVARTVTGTDGRYQFAGLIPGVYSIVEEQPIGYFEGDAHAGSVGGDVFNGSHIGLITLAAGENAIDYDFCEIAPAEISGSVYVDGNGDCIRDQGELPIAGVTIELRDAGGGLIDSTRTDERGVYRFNDLAPGQYQIREVQPEGYLHGGQTPGTGDGLVLGQDQLGVRLLAGQRLVDYDFCDELPSSVLGVVYVDDDGDCYHDLGEVPLQEVAIELRDESGRVLARTKTDANGEYKFEGLRAGSYEVFEQQPDGWFQGSQRVGTGDGAVLGDDLLGVQLLSGQEVIDYNFCELAPSSIQGSVWREIEIDQVFGPNEVPISGVMIELIDSSGDVIAQTRTNSEGLYQFESLAPGVYSVRQTQPNDLFHGGQIVGDSGGAVGEDDLLVGIVMNGGTNGRNYDFPEVPPATISGFVFQDGAAITVSQQPEPQELREYRDGRLTPDDSPLAGVTLELRNVLGQPYDAIRALAGRYEDGPIRTTTDAQGFYQFDGLRPGTYHVYQVQPTDYIDGLDSPGSTGGVAVNLGDATQDDVRIMIQTLAFSQETDPRGDAILNITLTSGGLSEQNNFSEILIVSPELPPLDFSKESEPSRLINPTSVMESFEITTRLVSFADPAAGRNRVYANDEWSVSWHLSVINGGFPLGQAGENGVIRSASARQVPQDWTKSDHAKGRWSITPIEAADSTAHRQGRSTSIVLGDENAIALTGDFDGDGSDEAVIYVAGQWFVDLNGNGFWDSGDLWVKLGTALDRPVVGDWDGDGKDDVGIFGRQWQHDPQKIARDRGLRDPANKRRRMREPHELASHREDLRVEDHRRLLRRSDEGHLRADAVDHVFKYGEQVDTPIVGDWNGDGIDQIAVFRNGKWLLDADGDGRWTSQDEKADFGRPGDEPIVGDFNGDLIDEIGVVRGDMWIIDTDGDRRITGNDLRVVVPRTSNSSQPIVGDFDGDGIDEPGYYDESA